MCITRVVRFWARIVPSSRNGRLGAAYDLRRASCGAAVVWGVARAPVNHAGRMTAVQAPHFWAHEHAAVVAESERLRQSLQPDVAHNAESVHIGQGSQAWQFGAHISLFGVQTPA
jgi:hypothetical protein